MSAVFGRRSRRLDPGRRGRRWGLLSATLLAVGVVGAAAARADNLTVAMDSARLLRLPAKVATVVIGNPMIADASLQRGGVLVITGKGYGTTNLLALDRDGRVVLDKTVHVKGPAHHNDLVVVYRGMDRKSYSCAPQCEPRITLGDSDKYFSRRSVRPPPAIMALSRAAAVPAAAASPRRNNAADAEIPAWLAGD